MVESQKGTSSASTDPKKKKSSLDEEIGNEFLNSWKSLSTAGDDTMDFSFDAVSSGKKKTFNFDKLDMDFKLDGDFDKLTSFKVDMPDLDFSSPSKNTAKPKERSKGGSSSGNHLGKRDCFNFSFDFNELDSFNFGSTLTEREKTPVKKLDSKGGGSDNSEHQGSKMDPSAADDGQHQSSKFNLAGADDGQTDKFLILTSTTTSAVETTLDGTGTEISSSNEFPSISGNVGDLIVSEGAKSLPEKTISASAEEADQQSHSLEKTVPTAHQVAHVLPVQIVDENGLSQDTESDIEASSKATKTNTESSEHNVSDTLIHSGSNHEILQLKNSATSCINRSESNTGESEKAYSDSPAGNTAITEPMADDSNLEAKSAANLLQERPREFETDNNIHKSTSKVPLRSSCSAPVIKKVLPIKEKDPEVVRSKFFKISKETEPQSCHPSSVDLKISSSGSKGVSSICPANGKREGFNANDSQAQRKLTDNLKSVPMEVTKEESAVLGIEKNVKNLHNTSCIGDPASLIEKATKSNTQTSVNSTAVVSSMGSTWNSKLISVVGLKSGKRTPELSSLKISRTMGVNSDQSNAVLKREINPLRTSVKNMEVKGITASKIGLPVVNAERKTLIPSLKRKTYEASNDDLAHLNMKKLLSQSPSESRNLKTPLERTAELQCSDHDKQPESDTTSVLGDRPTSEPELPLQLSAKEQNICLEEDGNVEKAEAYTKELEDICNMLKKKHEEVKELIVRAVVNNNSLLMLNHPMFDEKIRLVQKFAAQLVIN